MHFIYYLLCCLRELSSTIHTEENKSIINLLVFNQVNFWKHVLKNVHTKNITKSFSTIFKIFHKHRFARKVVILYVL